MRAKSKPSLQLVPSGDEQAILSAYRAMDDQGRIDALKMAIWSAENYPAPARRHRLTIMVAMGADEQALLRDFRSMDDLGKDDVLRFAHLVEAQSARRRAPLRLIVGGRA